MAAPPAAADDVIPPVFAAEDNPVAPDAPAIGEATGGDGAAIVRWTPAGNNGGAGVTGFVIRATGGNAVTAGADATSVRFPGLSNGSAVRFTVAARNALGKGAQSAPSAAVTPRRVAHFVVTAPPARRVVYGERSTVRAVLRTATGSGMPGQRVELLAKLRPSSVWRRVAATTTGSRGGAALHATLPATAALRLHHPPGAVAAPNLAVRSVRVARRVSAAVSRSATRMGMTVVVRGRVAPAKRVGSRVRLVQRASGSWVRVASGRMTTRSRYVVRWKPRRVGRYALRVATPADTARAAGSSRRWRQRVAPENAADIAADILRDKSITLATVHLSLGSDGATAQRNIIDLARGRRARTSCSGGAPCRSTTVDLRLLRAVRAMGARGTVTVSEIAGGSHAGGSDHYFGRGLDITWVNGRHVGWGSRYTPAVAACRGYGANVVYTPSNDPWGGHARHVHCAWG